MAGTLPHNLYGLQQMRLKGSSPYSSQKFLSSADSKFWQLETVNIAESCEDFRNRLHLFYPLEHLEGSYKIFFFNVLITY